MTEIRIELFGLGRYMGKHSDMDQVEVPFEMIRRIASRYGLDTEKLVRPFIKGMMDSIAEKRPPDRTGPGAPGTGRAANGCEEPETML